MVRQFKMCPCFGICGQLFHIFNLSSLQVNVSFGSFTFSHFEILLSFYFFPFYFAGLQLTPEIKGHMLSPLGQPGSPVLFLDGGVAMRLLQAPPTWGRPQCPGPGQSGTLSGPQQVRAAAGGVARRAGQLGPRGCKSGRAPRQ